MSLPAVVIDALELNLCNIIVIADRDNIKMVLEEVQWCGVD
jgi:hypothetical protein